MNVRARVRSVELTLDATRRRDRDEQAAANRMTMPIVAAVVAEFRAAFGNGIKVRWAREGGQEFGRPGEG